MPRPTFNAFKEEPSRSSALLVILVEGWKREYDYFEYFTKLKSNIKVSTFEGDNKEDELINPIFIQSPPKDFGNSPSKLLELAYSEFIKDLNFEDDQLWLVIDTDKWESEIEEVRKKCKSEPKIKIAQSNPCFEVWLFLHFYEELTDVERKLKTTEWKAYLDSKVTGGFNPKIHPVLIKTAISYSRDSYDENAGLPLIGTTQVFLLAEEIYKVLKNEIDFIHANFYSSNLPS